MQNMTMNLAQFMTKVDELFGDQMPTSETLRESLVPMGAVNIALPGSFGPDGIYKYEYTLACGTYIIVKCHRQHANAKGGTTCNSARFSTAQLYVGRDGKITHHVVWDDTKRKAKLVSKADWRRSNESINWSHIPVHWNSSPAPK